MSRILIYIKPITDYIPVPIPGEEKKITEMFIFTLLCGASKGFIKAFIKPFEAPQGSMKSLIFIYIKNSRRYYKNMYIIALSCFLTYFYFA